MLIYFSKMLFTIKYKATDGEIKNTSISAPSYQHALRTIRDLQDVIYKTEEQDFDIVKETFKFDELKHLHNAKVVN